MSNDAPSQAEEHLALAPARTGWEAGGHHVRAAMHKLTRAERKHVAKGYIGDATAATIRSLQRKAMFFLFIDSPNGRCGHLRLTPLGENVRAMIHDTARASSPQKDPTP